MVKSDQASVAKEGVSTNTKGSLRITICHGSIGHMAPLTFLIVSDEGLGERLADGVDLAGVAAALHADADVDVGEAVLAQEQDGLLQLVLQGRGLHQL